MKLTYWCCACLDDHYVYSIRAKTRKEALRRKLEEDEGGESYGEPTKVTVEYRDGFELLSLCLEEGGPYWEPYE